MCNVLQHLTNCSADMSVMYQLFRVSSIFWQNSVAEITEGVVTQRLSWSKTDNRLFVVMTHVAILRQREQLINMIWLKLGLSMLTLSIENMHREKITLCMVQYRL